MSLLNGRCCFAILILLTIFLMTGCGDDKSSEPAKTQVEQTQAAEKPKSAPQPLGEHWIKDANDVYLWNPKPQAGETITWSGDFVRDGDYKFAEGAGITTWYLDGEIEQIDEGTFKHGQRHGHFTHEFLPSGRVIQSNWDNGVEITENVSSDNVSPAKETFTDSDGVDKSDEPGVRPLREHADYIVSHAKSKFGVDNYTTGDSENLFRYSVYLMMEKLRYDNEKAKNPNFAFCEDAEAEKRFLALLTYLDKEGTVALNYAVYKHPDYIKKVLKEDHTLINAGISMAEIAESERQCDAAYNELKVLTTLSPVTDTELKKSLDELVQAFDQDFAEAFGADGSKVDDIIYSVLRKYCR